MTFIIKKAVAADAEGIHSMHMASIRQLCSSDYTSEQIAAWTSTPTPEGYVYSMQSGERMFVAVENGQVIGYSAIRRDEICAMFVHPDHVGRGVGKSLLRRAEREAFKKGFREAHLSSTLTAIQFYKKLGWIAAKKPTYQLRRGCKLPCISMKKRLLHEETTR